VSVVVVIVVDIPEDIMANARSVLSAVIIISRPKSATAAMTALQTSNAILHQLAIASAPIILLLATSSSAMRKFVHLKLLPCRCALTPVPLMWSRRTELFSATILSYLCLLAT
jgi:hypothetical protein